MTTQNLEIERMLVLSTAHLREATCNVWLPDYATRAPCIERKDIGWLVWVPDEPFADTKGMPNELQVVLGLARERDCAWVMFDCDGPVVEGLVTYEW